MTATLDQSGNATHATGSSLLDFDVIKERVANKREITSGEVTDGVLADEFGLTRETIWRFRHGALKPSFPTALAIAAKLGLTIDEITAKGNPTPKPPAGPSTPKPPAGPPTPSKPKAA